MISKEKFVDYLERYKELLNIEEKIDSSLKLLNPDFNSFSIAKHNSLILEMLKDLMHDTYDYIEYYIYELDWGKKRNKLYYRIKW